MRALALALVLFAAPAAAQDVTAAPGGILRWLDKMSGETADIELSAGQSAQSGRLVIQMDECRYPTDNPASDAFAHLTIIEKSAENGEVRQLFSGWMTASSPALSALDHPRYDVWVLHCITPDAPVIEEEPQPDEGEEVIVPQEG